MEKRYGFIHNEFDLKILLLFILNRLPCAVSLERLADMTTSCDGGISYFDFAECLTDLCQSGHIEEKNSEYSITDKGRENGEVTESGLPFSVRIKAERAASALSSKQQRSKMVTASHTTRGVDGYKVMLSMSDGVGPVMNLELFAPDERQAADMERLFKLNAETIYNKIIESLTE